MCIASCVDDRVMQNGFVELYFMLVLKPLFPVSGGHIIPVSILIFVVSPTHNAFIENLCDRKIYIPKPEKKPQTNNKAQEIINQGVLFLKEWFSSKYCKLLLSLS